MPFGDRYYRHYFWGMYMGDSPSSAVGDSARGSSLLDIVRCLAVVSGMAYLAHLDVSHAQYYAAGMLAVAAPSVVSLFRR